MSYHNQSNHVTLILYANTNPSGDSLNTADAKYSNIDYNEVTLIKTIITV